MNGQPKRKLRKILLLGVIGLVALGVAIPSVLAAATAQGVALSAWSDCNWADLDITLTTVGATREYGLTTIPGATLYQFEQSTGIPNFSGTYIGYGMPAGAPEGSIIGSYAYVGETPPSAADTAEFFVLYQCSDFGAQQVLYTCSGQYGSCPQTADQALTPGCDVGLSVPATAVGGLFVADAAAYWAPEAGADTGVVIAAGNTAKVIGVDASGAYYKIAWECQYLWVPVSTMGPNPDAVWNSAPLPTDVVD